MTSIILMMSRFDFEIIRWNDLGNRVNEKESEE